MDKVNDISMMDYLEANPQASFLVFYFGNRPTEPLTAKGHFANLDDNTKAIAFKFIKDITTQDYRKNITLFNEFNVYATDNHIAFEYDYNAQPEVRLFMAWVMLGLVVSAYSTRLKSFSKHLDIAA